MTHVSGKAGKIFTTVIAVVIAALGISDNLVRIPIGAEDPDDLIADFDQALAAV